MDEVGSQGLEPMQKDNKVVEIKVWDFGNLKLFKDEYCLP